MRFDGQNWQRHTTLDGLVDDSVHAIAFAPDGTLWIASWFGASHFDGQTWRSFPIENDQVGNSFHPLAITPDGNVWMGSGRGLLKLEKDIWQLVSEADLTVLSLLAMPDNTLWVGTDPGLMRWQEGELTQMDSMGLLDEQRVWAVMMSLDGRLWAGSSHGLFSYDGQDWTQAAVFENRTVISLAQGADGTLWAGSWDGGAARFDGQTWQTFTTQDGLASNIIHAISFAPDGSVWIAGQGGLSHYQH